MSLRVAIVVEKESYFTQIQQLLQEMDVYIVPLEEEPDVIITDGSDLSVYQLSEDSICTVFSIVSEQPQNVPETPQFRFYTKGKLSPKQFVADLQCWASIYELIHMFHDEIMQLNEELENEQILRKEHADLMKQSTEWQQKAMKPELGKDFLSALCYQSALFASGDFVCTKDYDDCSFFIVGDVSGHGISDALVGASFKSVLDTYMDIYKSRTQLEQLIAYMQAHKDCFYAKNCSAEEVFPYSVHILATKLNKRDYTLEICSVGYGDAPPLLISGNNVQVYECSSSAIIPPIGEYEPTPVVTKIPFHPGDGLILCSDGYTEAFVAKDKQDKQYEYKPRRLAESARRAVLHNINWTPDEVAHEINTDLKHYMQSSLREEQRKSHDDTTLLIIKWLSK